MTIISAFLFRDKDVTAASSSLFSYMQSACDAFD